MGQYSVMIKPASSLCNLRCKYCFYADVSNLRDVASYGMMDEATTERLLQSLERSLVPGDQLVLAFQGGEPTLAGLPYFEKLVAAIARWDSGIRVRYALQTNAVLLDGPWCRFLKDHDFLVGVSFDLLRDCHDAARVDAAGNATGKTVERAIALLEEYQVAYNVLCTLTNAVARHPQQVWKRLLQLDLRHVQFTPCLDALQTPGASAYALTPKRFASFYSQLFSYWYADYRAGKYRSIKLFDDVVCQLAFGAFGACGMGGSCQPQLVVEADGSAYPCDFYCLDQYRLGSLLDTDLHALLASPVMEAFLHRAHQAPALCQSCELLALCGGGCKRMQREIACTEGDTFCGYGSFLREHMQALRDIAAQERRARGQSANL